MRISLVAAVAANGVIGRDNGLPWRIPADLRHFKALTLGKPVVMGRHTFVSIGRPLPGRLNIVLTRGAPIGGVVTAASPAQAVAAAEAAGAGEAMVIGGEQVYRLFMDRADRIYLTEVHAEVEGDARFPAFERTAWTETARDDRPAEGETPAYSFVTLDRAP
ncbi:dihydrofolate reductase [Arenibaculum sp.]|jgi:dihydrofolate reductase|uniref:dihydrofolate reductase n=1 Tax=Arenibaculum sp. TaxID=2865862 RepID=UPI002E12F475|nr:dihydrofolate reductase [Arenibaculum sp.]